MHAEVLVAGTVADSIVGVEPLSLRPGDLGLTALDRVEAHELRHPVAVGGPGVHALPRLGVRRRVDVAADRLYEAVPEADVSLLLGGVAAQALALGLRRRLGHRCAQLGDRGRRVPVLPGVLGQLVAGQLARGPALVEGVLQHVPAAASLLDLLPDVVAH